jgi:glycosyltransferase involved in cell wall biosynthesis
VRIDYLDYERNSVLERSLTVLLPVQNAQTSLATTVHHLLDVLPELTHRFEVLIVDDGATEAASEAAYDLAKDFPQVKVVHQGGSTNREAAVRVGLQYSEGDVVMLGEPDCENRVHDIVRLWRAVDAGNRSFSPNRPSPTRKPAAGPGGFRMLRGRDAMVRADEPRITFRAEAAGPKPRPNFFDCVKRFALGE